MNSYTTHYIFTENLGNIPKPLKNLIEEFAKKVNAVETKVENFIYMLRSKSIEENLNKCLDILIERNSSR
jgi:hypothetical protein